MHAFEWDKDFAYGHTFVMELCNIRWYEGNSSYDKESQVNVLTFIKRKKNDKTSDNVQNIQTRVLLKILK